MSDGPRHWMDRVREGMQDLDEGRSSKRPSRLFLWGALILLGAVAVWTLPGKGKEETPPADAGVDQDEILRRVVELHERGEMNAAMQILEDSVRQWPRADRLWNELGVLRMRCGAWERARPAFDEAIIVNPSDAGYRLNRGQLRMKMGDGAGARSDLQEALRRAPAGWEHRGTAEQALSALEK